MEAFLAGLLEKHPGTPGPLEYLQQSMTNSASLFPGSRTVKSGFLLSLVEKPSSSLTAAGIPVVREFLDVFPADLPGMPPPRSVEFRIDLVPGARPVSMTPYRLARPFQEELKKQLDDLKAKDHSSQCVTVGSSCAIYQEEGW